MWGRLCSKVEKLQTWIQEKLGTHTPKNLEGKQNKELIEPDSFLLYSCDLWYQFESSRRREVEGAGMSEVAFTSLD